MTPEQFVFWLSGYLSGGRDNDNDVIINDVREAIKKVKIDKSIEVAAFFSGDCP